MIQSLIVDINNITNDEKEKICHYVGVYSDEEIVDYAINEGLQHCNNHKLQIKNSYSYYAQQYNDLERNFRKQTIEGFEELLDKNKNSVKQGTWSNVENHKIYADWLYIKLGYTTKEDWYKINTNMICKNRGGGLLPRYYNGSPIKFLKQVYPDIQWLPWKMTSAPNKFWNDMVNQKLFTEWLFNKLGYTSMKDWYKITRYIICKNYGSGLLSLKYKYSSSKMITSIYPDYKWDISKFKKSYSIGQIEWLNYLCVNTTDIRHMINNDEGEFNIPNSNYRADGYSKINNTIYEYHGDFWHGNPKIYNPDDINSITKTTYKELYDKTMQKQYFCEDNHYKYVSIWESEWLRGKNALIKIQRKYKSFQN